MNNNNMEKKYNQPAYPTIEQDSKPTDVWYTTPRMLLIDRIAIAAMQAIMTEKGSDYWTPKDCAETAYSYAASMMEERTKYTL